MSLEVLNCRYEMERNSNPKMVIYRYQGMDNLPATMTLGRRGQYAGLRTSGVATRGMAHADHGAANTQALLGAGGQYATLSKQCKTLESSDFY